MIDRRTDGDLLRDLRRATKDVQRTSERRRDLPPGSTRARVTTANARWSTACEARDRILAECERRGLAADGSTRAAQ